MAAYKTGAFVRSKYYTPVYKTPLKWIPRSKSGGSKSRPPWAAHTRIGNVWEYLPPPPQVNTPRNPYLNQTAQKYMCCIFSYPKSIRDPLDLKTAL